MAEIHYIGNIGDLINEVSLAYGAGRIKGLMCQLLLNDGTYATASAGDISYLEKLGLLESAKHDAFANSIGLFQPGSHL